MSKDDDRSSSRLTAAEAAARYEAVDPNVLNDWLRDLLPEGRGCVLDVGAGSGRDAAWLAGLGHEVVAVEPDGAMRWQAEQMHPDRRFELLPDRLPELSGTFRTGLSFDLVLLNAVWMFVAPGDRERAFRKLVTLLKPRGVIALTLRQGPVDPDRDMHAVSEAEIERLARRHGAYVESVSSAPDLLGRGRFSWLQVVVRLPDDGTGALPLVRRIVLNDDKSSTYKLGLLRAICRVAHGAPGLAREAGAEHVEIPLGVVALFWIRLYLPLLSADLPQNPLNSRDFRRIGFAKEPFRELSGMLSAMDLRPGARVPGDRGTMLHRALRDACTTIDRMPANYLTWPDKSRIFPVHRQGSRKPSAVVLDGNYLRSFGTLRVPVHLWRAMQRYAVWIEPALVEEWIGLTAGYAERQSRTLDEHAVRRAMRWYEPERDIGTVRKRVDVLMESQSRLHCVWTGKRLRKGGVDIDHCFPWSAWPCDDLWNLMPATRQVNQRDKRDLLPDDRTLRGAKERILEWWELAYCSERVLDERFRLEAGARLPALGGRAKPDDIFTAMSLQRMRLSNDQQVPEWGGPTPPV